MITLNKYETNMKVEAVSKQEAVEIENFFIHLMNNMDYGKLIKAVRKVNLKPEEKVAKMSRFIGAL